jgi:hypothetical protein
MSGQNPRLTFRATLDRNGKTATGFRVPADVVAGLGSGKRPRVRVTLAGHSYRSSVAVMGGEFLVGVSAEQRALAGVAAGDELDITLELDTEPREVSVPPDFAAALDSDATARQHFDALSYSNKQRYVLAVEAAKKPETRQRRIIETVDALREGPTGS